VVLTSSEDIRDVNVAYKLGANSFMVKPMDFEDVVHMSQFLSRYWLKLSKAPDTFRQPRHRTSKPENSRNEPDGKTQLNALKRGSRRSRRAGRRTFTRQEIRLSRPEGSAATIFGSTVARLLSGSDKFSRPPG